MTGEVEKNKVYFGISIQLAIAIENGSVKAEAVERYIMCDKDPEDLLKTAPAPAAPAPAAPEGENLSGTQEPPPGHNPTREEIEAMSVISLKEYAKSIGIDVKSRDPKSDIVDMVMQRFEIPASTEEPAKE